MNFLQLYGEELDRELGSDDRTQLFTISRRKQAINMAQMRFVQDTECLIRQGTVALLDGIQEYDLEASFQDFLQIARQGVEFVHTDAQGKKTYASGDDLLRRDIHWLNRAEPGWRNASTGTPHFYYIREDGGSVFIGLVPPPKIGTGESAVLTVPYVARPADMVNDADEPFTIGGNPKKSLEPWHPALVKYAAYLLEQFRKNLAVADKRLSEYASYVVDYIQKQRPRGGGHVQFARNYRAEVGHKTRPADPRR